jgi:hypothetical protein
MMEVLNFIFQDFGHWLGTAVLLSIIFGSLGRLFTVISIKSPKAKEPEKRSE